MAYPFHRVPGDYDWHRELTSTCGITTGWCRTPAADHGVGPSGSGGSVAPCLVGGAPSSHRDRGRIRARPEDCADQGSDCHRHRADEYRSARYDHAGRYHCQHCGARHHCGSGDDIGPCCYYGRAACANARSRGATLIGSHNSAGSHRSAGCGVDGLGHHPYQALLHDRHHERALLGVDRAVRQPAAV
jgi:hypothetical protein